MPIKSIQSSQTGLVGVLPSIAYIETNDSVSTITTTGYLNGEVQSGVQFSLPCIAAVITRATPTSSPDVGWYQVVHVGSDWSLTAGSNTAIDLTDGHIFVGNAQNIATDVAMTGDVTISNAGVTAITAGAIVNADINAAAAIAYSKLATMATGSILLGNAGVPTATAMSGDITIGATGVTAIGAGKVLLAMLGTGIAPAAVIKYFSQYTTTGGAAAEAITVTGAVGATDRAFVQMVDDGTNNVTVVSAVVTNDTLTVTFSADPGNDAVINYQIIRAAA